MISRLHFFLSHYGIALNLIAGSTLTLAFAPFGIWPFAFVCPALLFFSWREVKPARAAALGLAFGIGLFSTGLYWLYGSLHVIGEIPLWLTACLMLILISIMSGYLALMGYVQARWLPTQGVFRYVIGLPALWVLIEWLRGWFMTGFPWWSLGYSQINTPLAGLAPIVGVYGVSYACALLAGGLLIVVIGTLRQRWIGIGVCLLPWFIVWPVWHHEWTQAIDHPLSVAIVQGAVPEDVKWTPSWRDKTVIRYRAMTEPYFGTPLIVWPEAALPYRSNQIAKFVATLEADAHNKGSDLVMGLIHFDPKPTQHVQPIFNGVLAFSGHEEWYHQRHLIPFAEYFPVPRFIRNWLRLMNLPNGDFAAGESHLPALNAAGQKIAATTCYEDGFGAEQLSALSEATLLVNVSNDAWFGDSTAPAQHFQISRMRALEAGRDLIRAANDGITAAIGSTGNIIATIPRFQADVLTTQVQPRSGLTPYARIGNWGILLVCIVLVLMAGIVADYE